MRLVRQLLGHMVFYFLAKIVEDCEQSLTFFWITIDGEHGKSRARARNDGVAWAKIFHSSFCLSDPISPPFYRSRA